MKISENLNIHKERIEYPEENEEENIQRCAMKKYNR